MMMEEADHIPALDSALTDTESVICDALQDAAQTYVYDSMQQVASDGSSLEVDTSIAVAQLSSSFTGPSSALSSGQVPQLSSSFTGPSSALSAGPVPQLSSSFTGPSSALSSGLVPQLSSSFTGPSSALSSGPVPQMSSSFTGPSSALSAGPVPLPSNVVGMSLTSPFVLPSQFVTEFPPVQSFPSGSAPHYQPTTPPSGHNVASTVGMLTPAGLSGTTLPPPPTMGFVPAHGVVAGNPVKYHNVTSPLQTDTVTHIFTPIAAATPVSAVEEFARGDFGAAHNHHIMATSFSPSYGQVNLPSETQPTSYSSYTSAEREPSLVQKSEGFFGWLPGSGLMHKVLEKTKSSVESVITTLDPGMKAVIYSGGYINILVTSTKEVKVGAVREAFQTVFGRATVVGVESQPTIAPQPVGYSSGFRGAEERIENLRQSGAVDENQALVSVENFIVELLPDRWFDIGCIILKDPRHNIELSTFSQATPVPADCICVLQDATPSDYPLRWSGLAMTVGQAIQQREPHIDHADWHVHYTGVSRRTMLASAAHALAGMYRSKLVSLGYTF